MKNNSNILILSSRVNKLKKIVYTNEKGYHFYTVIFYDPEDNSIMLCASSQIGCVERCRFCATGDSPFIRNLSCDEIANQFRLGVEAMKCFLKKDRPQFIWIVMEGMGEPSYNLNNCLEALNKVYPQLKKQFKKIYFRISSIGNPELIKPYKEYIIKNSQMKSVEFELQLSLHTPFDKERKKLIPMISSKYTLKKILKDFYSLSDFLGKKLKVNYMLLISHGGFNNFSENHINELAKILTPKRTEIKLTKYSEIGKDFYSPDKITFERVKKLLEQKGFEVVIREIIGQDINAACGMLHYEDKA